jgi:hypothetical protein
MSGLIDPTAPPPWTHLLDADGNCIARNEQVHRMRIVRLDADGNPTGEAGNWAEVDCSNMIVRQQPKRPTPCVPIDTTLRRYMATLDLELL